MAFAHRGKGYAGMMHFSLPAFRQVSHQHRPVKDRQAQLPAGYFRSF
jgi:hypothetical protein